MSNIYIQEPPTAGKVLLKTTVGDIDIELWSKECPKTCRNFVQLCTEGYYNNTIFHRVVKGFIVQGGDPEGDGTGGESIYGGTFKDEFHSRLRYARRGLVGMANSGKDDNGSQFFFTMAPTTELQNKNTLFGKVTGDTVFNMLKLEEGLVDHNERPMYPQRILKTEILHNPFDDIVPRVVPPTHHRSEKKETKKKREKGVKNFCLLSFGEEAEEDEVQTNDFVRQNAGKAKSMHDVVDDPKLSRDVIKIERVDDAKKEHEHEHAREQQLAGDSSVKVKEEPDDAEDRKKRIQAKLKSSNSENKTKEIDVKKEEKIKIESDDSNCEEDMLLTHEQEQKQQRAKLKDKIQQQIRSVKKEYQADKKAKDEILEKKAQEQAAAEAAKIAVNDNDMIKDFLDEREKYSHRNSKLPKKGAGREDFTLSLLSKFRTKLDSLRQKQESETSEQQQCNKMNDKDIENDIQSDNWMAHELRFHDEDEPVLAKDASTKGDDWYDAYDPRNPLNKRKRGEGKSEGKSESSLKRKK